MPQSFPRILLHGHEVVGQFSLPIGLLSEEAQGSRNKDSKKFREHFSRKCSRKKTSMDVLRRLLCSLGPLISSYRKKSSCK